jgi:hypothetical protein
MIMFWVGEILLCGSGFNSSHWHSVSYICVGQSLNSGDNDSCSREHQLMVVL